MIIDSPIISGSYSASGSLNQFGNVVISGSLTVTGSIIGTASFASTASYLSGYVSPFPFTGSAIISGSLDVTGSLKVTGSITTTGTLTAQTLVVQTVSSSVIYSSGSNVFGNSLANTQILTGSVSITGSLAVNGSNAVLTNQTSSMSASYAANATSASSAISSSFANTAGSLVTTSNYQMASLGVGTAPVAPFKGNFYGQVIVQNGINNATGQQSLIFAYPGITNNLTHSIWSGHDASVANYNKLDFYIGKTSGLAAVNVLSLRSSQPVLIGSDTGLGLTVSGSTVISGSLTSTTGITGSLLGTSSFANTATSASYALTASFSLNVPVTSSYANNANSASYALSSSFATTASYLSGYVSPFPFTGSAIISGSLTVTGSLTITGSNTLIGTKTITGSVFISGSKNIIGTNTVTGSMLVSGSTGISGSLTVNSLSGSGVRYLVTDESGSVTAQSASAALKSTQAFTSTAGQTTFSVTNGYSTGYVDVFINGSKLSAAEFTDTSGTNIVLATGSFSGDTVEVVKYIPAAGVTNNVLRQLTTFTGSAGQTVFSASYTPGLLDIFYNGSRLSPSDYTANNGTFFTLATGSAANDILDVLVYSYQVGAFSGIGGAGVTNQLSFFNTTSSISGSTNLTYNGSTLTLVGNKVITGSVFISGSKTIIGTNIITGSLFVTGSQTFIGTKTITGSVFISGSKTVIGNNTVSGSMSISGSLDVNGTITATTLVVQTVTSSVIYSSGSNVFGNSAANTQTFTGSVLVTGSVGIGGNPSAWSGGTENALQVKKASIYEYGGYETALSVNTYYDGSWKYIGTNSATQLQLSAGNYIFRNAGSGTAGTAITWSDRMYISSSGAIGIGTSTVVEGTQPASSISIFPTSSVSNGPLIQFAGNGRIRPADTGNRLSIDGNALYLNSYIGGNTIMNTAGGGVAIGTASPGSNMVAIGGSASSNFRLAVENSATGSSGTSPLINCTNQTDADLQISITKTGATLKYALITPSVSSQSIVIGTNSNNIGINTTAPPFRLTVAQDVTNEGDIVAGQFAVCGASILGKRLVVGYDTNGSGYGFIESGYLGNTWTYTAIQGSGGNVVIGQLTDPGYKLTVNGTAYASGAAGALSDIRHKNNIIATTKGLTELLQLKPIEFKWKDVKDSGMNGTQLGFIAQEVQEILPTVVLEMDNEEKTLGLKNNELLVIAIKAIQEQQTLITTLQEKLERNNIN